MLCFFEQRQWRLLAQPRLRWLETEMKTLREVYDEVYDAEDLLSPIVLRPDALSTTRYDDAARLLRNERGRLLELGGATGRLTVALAPFFDELVCTDLSESMINVGRQHVERSYPDVAAKIRMLVASAGEPLPFPDCSFDVVVASAVLEHVLFLFQAMDEAARVCRPGGCVVLTVPNLAYVKNVIDLIRGRLPITGLAGVDPLDMATIRRLGWDGHHLHYFTRSSLGALLEHVGFRPEEWTGDGRYARLRRWSTNLVGNLTVRARRTIR